MEVMSTVSVSVWQFLQAHWQSDPCYAFYGVDGTPCSILTYLSQVEDFCPPPHGRSHSAPPWHQKLPSYTEKVVTRQTEERLSPRSNALFDTITIQQTEIRTNLSPLYEELSNSSSPTVDFIHSRVARMSDRWIRAGLRIRQRVNSMDSNRMRV